MGPRKLFGVLILGPLMACSCRSVPSPADLSVDESPLHNVARSSAEPQGEPSHTRRPETKDSRHTHKLFKNPAQFMDDSTRGDRHTVSGLVKPADGVNRYGWQPAIRRTDYNTKPASFSIGQPDNRFAYSAAGDEDVQSSDARSDPAGALHDEFLCQGGDQHLEVRVGSDWSVQGLDSEDTVAHFDTLDGRTIVESSNRVCIYAPRFAAVRKITSLAEHYQRQRIAGFEAPLQPQLHHEERVAVSAVQPIQSDNMRDRSLTGTIRERERSTGVENVETLGAFQNEFLPYENFQAMRTGVHDNLETALLVEYAEAATTWTHDKGVQVIIQGVVAEVDQGIQRPQATVVFVDTPGRPRLRLIKLCSTKHAQPGDAVEFTLRFDNIGDELIGNVTLIDNLTTRLEYVPDSSQSSRDAEFFTQANDGESLVLRWEITDPLEPGEGGIIRFQCKVR